VIRHVADFGCRMSGSGLHPPRAKRLRLPKSEIGNQKSGEGR